MKTTIILCLVSFTLSSTVFVSCEEKRKRRSSSRSSDRSSSNSRTTATEEIDTPDKLTDEFLVIMTRMIDIYLTATDKDSAVAAATNLEELYDDVDALIQRFDQFEEPNQEEKNHLKAKLDAWAENQEVRFGEMSEDPEASAIIATANEKFMAHLKQHRTILNKFGLGD